MKLRNKKTGEKYYGCEARISFITPNFRSYWYDSFRDFCEDWEIVEDEEEGCES